MLEPAPHKKQNPAPEKDYACRELLTDQEWSLAWAALATLRPNLSHEQFLSNKTQLQLDGYHLIGLFKEDKVVSVASYTISPHPVFRREMIIHDMSTLAGEGSKGYGSEVLSFLDTLAVQLNCGRTIVSSAKASKFYEQNGYTPYASALKKIHSLNTEN